MTKFSTKLLHLRIQLFGDKKLEKEGKVIPCKKCDKLFKSYCHFSGCGYSYDSLCDSCGDKKEKEVKK